MPPDKPDNELETYPVVITLPVQWGDMDAFGHVNNTIPIRWFESARIAYLEHGGLEGLMRRGHVGPILAAVSCNYRQQVLYPDTVQVTSRTSRLGRTSFTLQHAVFSARQDRLVADGESVVVMFDYNTQRPVRVPEAVSRKIETIEGQPIGDPSSNKP